MYMNSMYNSSTHLCKKTLNHFTLFKVYLENIWDLDIFARIFGKLLI